MTYSISGNTATGKVNLGKLTQEIIDAGLGGVLTGINTQGDTLDIHTSGDFDQGTLDAVVGAHVAVSLTDLKTAKCRLIDDRTDEIIATGFTFDSHSFSLSAEAQRNWLGVYALREILTFPLTVTTQPAGIYSLTSENLTGFITGAFSKVAYAITTGQILKVSILTASDQATLDAIVDSR